MKKFIKVNVTYTWKGVYEVEADNKAHAKEIVNDSTGATLDTLQASDMRIVDWNFPVHPMVKIR